MARIEHHTMREEPHASQHSSENCPYTCRALQPSHQRGCGSRASGRDLHQARVVVYFSPNGGVTDAVVRELHAATTQVFMQAYAFTSAPIAKAIVEAHKHGGHLSLSFSLAICRLPAPCHV
jgi:hypothetical protein